MRIGFLIDRPPIFNGGFSQRIKRETKLVSEIENSEIYMHVFISIRSSNGEKIQDKMHEIYDCLNIKGYKFSFLISSKLAFNRKIYDNLYVKKVISFIKEYKIDYLICENLWAAYIGNLACKKTGIKCIFDYHGVVPEEMVFEGNCVLGDKRYNYLKQIENYALINSEAVVCVSNSFKKYLIENFNLKNKKIETIPCCINKNEIFFDIQFRKELRSKMKINNKKVIIYAGSITKYQCIEEMIWIFSELLKRDKDFYFIFLSAYSDYLEVKKIFEKMKISNENYFINSVPHNEVKKYYSAADIGLIIREDHLLNQVASPTKIAEYLSCGLPIIGTNCIGDLNDIKTNNIILSYQDIKNKKIDCIMPILELSISEESRNANYMKCKEVLLSQYLWEGYKEYYKSLFN